MAGYQIKVTIEGTKPPMWRRLVVPDKITFGALHQILQIAFGWWDCHLHDFEFQHMRGRVGDMESADVEYEEREYLIDEPLENGWIRYTYDFGDDWQHKIVLEKKLPDYNFRYPQVIKYKRNNFEEDSGGVWNGFSCEEYDIAAVNDKLQQCCMFKISRKHKKLFPESDSFSYGDFFPKQELEKALRELREMMENVLAVQESNERRANAEPSVLDNTIWEIAEFYDELESEWDSRPLGTARLVPAVHTMEQVLLLSGEVHLRDYLKYLGIPLKKSWKVRTMVKRVAECLQNHPEYMLFLLEEDELEWLLNACRGKWQQEPSENVDSAKSMKEVTMPDQTTLIILASWGLAEPVFIKDDQGKGKKVQLSFTNEAVQIVQQLRQEDLKLRYREVEEIWKQIRLLLSCYGYLELDVMYEKYINAFGMIDREVFLHYIYLRGRFCGNIASGFDWTGNQWIATGEEIAVAVTETRLKYAIGKPELELPPYADFSKEQICSMEFGFADLYPQWGAVRELFEESCEDIILIDALLSELYTGVISGYSLETLMRYVCDMLPELNRIEQERIKTALRRCWCEMGIPALNGHSRREIAKLNHMRVEEVIPKLKEEPEDIGEEGVGEESKAAGVRISPDDPCPCGSGKRYRQCCGRSCAGGH